MVRRGNGDQEDSRRNKRSWLILIRVTLALSVTVALTLSIYNTFVIRQEIDELNQQQSGWKLETGRTRTELAVSIEDSLDVNGDIRMSGSALEMVSSNCESEGRASRSEGRLCFDAQDQELKVSENGGPFVSLKGQRGERGLRGEPGRPGLSCWDLDGDRERDEREDVNDDGSVDALDCRGPRGVPGRRGEKVEPGEDGLQCWDLNGDGVKDRREDLNRDGEWDASDC